MHIPLVTPTVKKTFFEFAKVLKNIMILDQNAHF